MNIQHTSLTKCTVEFLHWVTQIILKLNFFTITKRVSDWHHFCEWKFLLSILQVAVSVGTMQLTLSIAIMQVPTSVAIMQFLRFYCSYVSVPFLQVKVSATNMWVTIFIEIMHLEVSVTIMQVVFSMAHYANDYFYCNYAGDWL